MYHHAGMRTPLGLSNTKAMTESGRGQTKEDLRHQHSTDLLKMKYARHGQCYLYKTCATRVTVTDKFPGRRSSFSIERSFLSGWLGRLFRPHRSRLQEANVSASELRKDEPHGKERRT
jgi:hypothetical protein